jgi:DNA replication protein DnaC
MKTFDELKAEAVAEAARDLAARPLRYVLAKRPRKFADPGELHPDIAAWVARFLDDPEENLVLFGPVGVGKTWSIWKALEVMAAAGWKGRFDVVEPYAFKRACDRPVDQEALDKWATVDLLILDDIGSQCVNTWQVDALLALIDRRWQHCLPIAATSNLADLEGVIGERAASRLADGATTVVLSGVDRRSAR